MGPFSSLQSCLVVMIEMAELSNGPYKGIASKVKPNNEIRVRKQTLFYARQSNKFVLLSFDLLMTNRLLTIQGKGPYNCEFSK